MESDGYITGPITLNYDPMKCPLTS